MLGYGLLDRLSAYLRTTLQGKRYFSDGHAGISLGVFGTPVDTRHFDLDLLLDISACGNNFARLEWTPSLELNFDIDPEHRSFGLYLRAGVPLYGRSMASDTSHTVEQSIACSVSLNPGAYLTIAERHQVLLEYDMLVHPLSADGRSVDVGGVALGYNVRLSQSIELISQVRWDIPQRGESWSFGLMLGLIATLPSARQATSH